MNAGDSFLIQTPPNDYHLFVAICPLKNGNMLCVNVTTQHPHSETSCILKNGDHDFITHDSVIGYKHAREINPTIKAHIIPKKSFSANILKKIQDGGLASKQLKNKYKKELKSFIGV